MRLPRAGLTTLNRRSRYSVSCIALGDGARLKLGKRRSTIRPHEEALLQVIGMLVFLLHYYIAGKSVSDMACFLSAPTSIIIA